jgi:hypothetical protein
MILDIDRVFSVEQLATAREAREGSNLAEATA